MQTSVYEISELSAKMYGNIIHSVVFRTDTNLNKLMMITGILSQHNFLWSFPLLLRIKRKRRIRKLAVFYRDFS